jgi:hypothetical protein
MGLFSRAFHAGASVSFQARTGTSGLLGAAVEPACMNPSTLDPRIVMPVFYGPAIEAAHLKGLHGFLAARGWRLAEQVHRDEGGYPVDSEAAWRYPGSFGGIAMHEIAGITPDGLSCRFNFEDGLSIFVLPAGNENGCSGHDQAEHFIAVDGDDLDLDRLGGLLDDLETHARMLNARELVECRFFGPCGENNHLL